MAMSPVAPSARVTGVWRAFGPLPSSACALYKIHVPARIAAVADPTINFFIVISSRKKTKE
jgi:hypothetical protein